MQDTENINRIHGIATHLSMFDYLYIIILGKTFLLHAHKLCSTFQEYILLAVEGQQISNTKVKTLQILRKDELFDLLGAKNETATA